MSPLSFGLGKNLSSGGGIVTNGLVLSLDAGRTNSYPGTGTTWTDLSGNGNNGTLVGGVGYNSGSSLVDLDVQGFLGATVPSGSELDIPLETVSGTGFGATVSYASNGQIFYIQILNGGGGYTSGSVLRLPMGSNPTIVLGNLPAANPVLSLTFDGSNDYVSGTIPPLTGNYTVELTFNLYSSNVADNSLIALTSSNTHGFLAEVSNSDKKIRFLHRFPYGSGGGDSFYSSGSINLFQIYSISWVRDSNQTIYINGNFDSQITSTNSAFDSNLTQLTIGQLLQTSNARNINGAVYSTKIYNRALSSAEVSQNFNALRSRYGI